MSSLKETIEKFAQYDCMDGSSSVDVEDIPGIIVSALQDLADYARQEANLSEHPQRYRGLMDMAIAIESYQANIVHELM